MAVALHYLTLERLIRRAHRIPSLPPALAVSTRGCTHARQVLQTMGKGTTGTTRSVRSCSLRCHLYAINNKGWTGMEHPRFLYFHAGAVEVYEVQMRCRRPACDFAANWTELHLAKSCVAAPFNGILAYAQAAGPHPSVNRPFQDAATPPNHALPAGALPI
mgnify:CR=1 FL=1